MLSGIQPSVSSYYVHVIERLRQIVVCAVRGDILEDLFS